MDILAQVSIDDLKAWAGAAAILLVVGIIAAYFLAKFLKPRHPWE